MRFAELTPGRVIRCGPASLTQDQIALKGHAIEARVYAENPAKNFMPSVGRISTWRMPPENEGLRNTILQIQYDETSPDLFQTATVPPRAAPVERKSFEPAWRDYREGRIYKP